MVADRTSRTWTRVRVGVRWGRGSSGQSFGGRSSEQQVAFVLGQVVGAAGACSAAKERDTYFQVRSRSARVRLGLGPVGWLPVE